MSKHMISMARTPQEMADAANPTPHDGPLYPYGLCICLDQETLDKLDLDTGDVEVGDMLHIAGMATVTSVSKNDTGDGPKHRIEAVLSHIKILEDEDDEA